MSLAKLRETSPNFGKFWKPSSNNSIIFRVTRHLPPSDLIRPDPSDFSLA
jgi:hypothetical protein